jgi:ADP-heptose:LPS heptosyltransferase
LRFPEAELRVFARPDVQCLLSPYQRSAQLGAAGLASELEIRLGQSGQPARLEAHGARQRLLVPDAPYPARLQHASAHAVDAAQAAGLPARAARPRLRIEPSVHKQARALCRRLAGGGLGGPLVVLTPGLGGWSTACFAQVAKQLAERIGARSVVLGEREVPGAVHSPVGDPALTAALLALAAVCVGDDGDWSHVAAAVGAPTLIVHGDSSPDHSGPSCRRGVSAFTTSGTCAQCLQHVGRRCLSCLEPLKVTALAERLAARRWPLDRLQRVLP